MNLSILVPVYNEGNAIRKTLEDLNNILTKSNINQFEIIAINDGSTDSTLEEIMASNIEIELINHKTNKGYGASLKTGLRIAKYENIAITDADSTYPNHRIPEMLEYYTANKLDMLIGARIGGNVSYPVIKKIPKYFIVKLANYISGTKIKDINSGLRIFNKDIAKKFYNLYPDGFSFTTTITMSMLCKSYEVDYFPIDYYNREGKSKISPVKDTAGFFNLLSKIAIYYNPLKFFLPFVGILLVISIIFLIRDVSYTGNLSQSSVLFPILTIFIFLMGNIADMISKK